MSRPACCPASQASQARQLPSQASQPGEEPTSPLMAYQRVCNSAVFSGPDAASCQSPVAPHIHPTTHRPPTHPCTHPPTHPLLFYIPSARPASSIAHHGACELCCYGALHLVCGTYACRSVEREINNPSCPRHSLHRPACRSCLPMASLLFLPLRFSVILAFASQFSNSTVAPGC